LLALAGLGVIAWVTFLRAARSKTVTRIYKHPSPSEAPTVNGDPPERERVEKQEEYSPAALRGGAVVVAVLIAVVGAVVVRAFSKTQTPGHSTSASMLHQR